jgi:4-amino-4-deoxy-L-arabinose transferase-like glycosyltransferase
LPACLAAFLLYLYGLDRTGMLSADEPRYAAIGLEMAQSGDWITPRLWGDPWFEKPPLLYWMTAVGFRVGLSEDLAPRIPVALASLGFLAFFWNWIRRRYDERTAAYAVTILGTSAAWLVDSHVAVTDLPLSACLGVAMLLGIGGGSAVVAGVFLGLAILAKSLLPLVLFAPALWFLRRYWRRLAMILGVAIAVAAPWYLLMTLRHGTPFLADLFLKHQFGRFTNDALQHGQPFWYYLPVLLGCLFPWSPLAGAVCRRDLYVGEREKFLLTWLLFGLLFFSSSRNKLAGYLLPLLPPLVLLIALGVQKARSAKWMLAASALLLGLIPTVSAALPQILAVGLSRSALPVSWVWVVPALVLAGLVWWLDTDRALASLGIFSTCAIGFVIWQTYPVLDRTVSARSYWREHGPSIPCDDHPSRTWRYGLNYYARRVVPNCNQKP